MPDLPCNCFHAKEDHHPIIDCGYDVKAGQRASMVFYTWCRYSETGQCPCDAYTSMTNLEFLEWKSYLNDN